MGRLYLWENQVPSDTRCIMESVGVKAESFARAFEGFTDPWLRTLGAHIKLDTVVMLAVPDSDVDQLRSYWRIEPGVYFTLQVQATRAGREYGASQPLRFFKTEKERAKAVDRYLNGAVKRAAKMNELPKKGIRR